MRSNQKLVVAAAVLASLSAVKNVSAAVITEWTFNSVPADSNTSTGTTTPAIGLGTALNIGGTTVSFATGSPNDTTSSTDNSGWALTGYPAQGTASGTAGAQYNLSTAGYTNLVISLDFRQSGTASQDFQLQLSTDGTTFTPATGGTASIVGTQSSNNSSTTFNSTNGVYVNNPGGGTQAFVYGIQYALAAGSVYENDPGFAFRWASVFPTGTTSYQVANPTSTYAGSGTSRFDEVTVSGTAASVPEPASVAGIIVSGAALLKRRRKI